MARESRDQGLPEERENVPGGGDRARRGGAGVARTGSSATLSGAHTIDEEYYNLPRAHGNPHGKASSWVVVITAIVALIVGAVAFVMNAWILMWICVAVAVLCIPAGLAVKIMDDTVSWGAPTPGSIPRGEIIRGANRIHDRDQHAEREARDAEREQVEQRR
ncbi:hypothetical protein [Actinocorallia sp. A-T 12471]|uniref:hypothetical protein n=1 Tax=Actinocorallia sp. A-T 12471 TaxID=3089813 RepID=UPI0029CEA151|nr:hypothetical protein [Actinocorallia sp. A-T 12471]MDX6741877.1 hypothetical protein [Actinocorallia sp. A-T 12471]